MKNIIKFPLAIIAFFAACIHWVYRRLTWKYYYITSTCLIRGQRMYVRTVFATYGNVLPIKSIESMIVNDMKPDDGQLIILNYQRLPRGMARYVSCDYTEGVTLSKNF